LGSDEALPSKTCEHFGRDAVQRISYALSPAKQVMKTVASILCLGTAGSRFRQQHPLKDFLPDFYTVMTTTCLSWC
jgi:hypothetical protein